MKKNKKLVIVGIGETAEIAYEYFSDYSEYEVIGFSVDSKFISENNKSFYGLPIFPFESIEKKFSPNDVYIFVAISYTQLNRIRTKFYIESRKKGYRLASFVHPSVFLGRGVEIGDNCFIFEDNNIQRKVHIGNNVIIWAKNHIGHRSFIDDNSYLASGIIVSGFCKIGKSCFLGVNCSLNDKINIANDTVLGNGAIVINNIIEPGGVYVGNPAQRLKKSSYEIFNVKEVDI